MATVVPIENLKTITVKVVRKIWVKDDFGILVVEDCETRITFNAKGGLGRIKENTVLDISGLWEKHERHGLQFNVHYWRSPMPQNRTGIIEFLATLDGISHRLATQIYDQLEADVYHVLEKDPQKLLSIPGIGKKKLEKMLRDYQSKMPQRELTEFLVLHNVSPYYSEKIYKELGDDSVEELKNNPYQLIQWVRGMNFRQADEIAKEIGIKPDLSHRIEAAIEFFIYDQAYREGHTFTPYNTLFWQVKNLVKLPRFNLSKTQFDMAFQRLLLQQKVYQEEERVYLYENWQDEKYIAEVVRKLNVRARRCCSDINLWLKYYESSYGISLAPAQKQAIQLVNEQRLAIIAGGAGTGKSTISRAVVALWESQNYTIALCAPTGRAAQRLAELTGREAQTIHRLLGWNGDDSNIKVEQKKLFDYQCVLVDEAGMLNNQLMGALLRSLPRHIRLVLVGDPNQLLPIGCGMAFQEMLQSNLPNVTLNQIFRQGTQSGIIPVAYAILHGQQPTWTEDAQFINAIPDTFFDSLEKILTKLLLDGYKPDDIQIIAPMNKNQCGNIAINKFIQNLWNPQNQDNELNGLRLNDRIINIENDYNKNIFNGDLGTVIHIDQQEQTLTAQFGEEAIEFTKGELDMLRLAYSISIHKAQGSEFPVVICPIFDLYRIMLNRNLLYTAVTRAQQRLIILGQQHSLDYTIKNIPNTKRRSTLKTRLLSATSTMVEHHS